MTRRNKRRDSTKSATPVPDPTTVENTKPETIEAHVKALRQFHSVEAYTESSLWNCLSGCVAVVLSDRDSSHGWDHCRRVATQSLHLIPVDKLQDRDFVHLVMVVAWLHDIADKKYNGKGFDHEGLQLLFENPAIKFPKSKVCDIIDYISYSTEKKAEMDPAVGAQAYREKMLGDLGDTIVVRDIVSDADKIEALGHGGWDRTVVYTSYKIIEANDHRGVHHLVDEVVKHCDEKLLRLKDHYIRTPAGKTAAETPHLELEALYKKAKAKIESQKGWFSALALW